MEHEKIKVKVKVADLRHPAKNTRKHPQKQINEMKRSLNAFGQFRDVVVDESGVVLVGNGLVMAMRELGWEECDALRYTNLTENEKKKLMIADNQVASLGVDDYSAIEEILNSLAGDYDVPGYDEEMIKLIVEQTDSVMDTAMSYGVYEPEDVNALKETERAREENGLRPVQQPSEPVAPSMQVTARTDEGQGVGKVYAKPQEAERYIICPHCGEKIYI